ncbi:hypothetical protein [Adhaeribacter aquaticus]|uniref:hypothetical protein n=1 Tax=Adhaeribacter aquaticus TaxID=299567 RepID=UPI0012FA5805|nr:hypothetical protein [Adhaeribacter aquaticus]
MKKTRLTETQIIKALKEHKAGRNAQEFSRGLDISTSRLLQVAPALFRFEGERAKKDEGVGGRESPHQMYVFRTLFSPPRAKGCSRKKRFRT